MSFGVGLGNFLSRVKGSEYRRALDGIPVFIFYFGVFGGGWMCLLPFSL